MSELSLDPEVSAMAGVVAAVSELDPSTQTRVLRWACQRFGVTDSDSGGSDDSRPDTPPIRPDDERDDSDVRRYDHFAELFDAAGPSSGGDKALVAGYWFQVCNGADSFKSAPLQSELRNLGHAVGNITTSLSQGIQAKPARVLQLAKSGSAKQARKSYKLTREGIARVESMIQGAQ